MPTRAELKELARTRLKEAKTLYDSGLYDGASYLAGYVIELALKARICKILDLNVYPETGEIARSFKTHKLDDFIRLAGLQRKFDRAKASNPSLLTVFSREAPAFRLGRDREPVVKARRLNNRALFGR